MSTRHKDEENVDLVVSNWFRTIVEDESQSIEHLIKVIFEFYHSFDRFDEKLYRKEHIKLSNDNRTMEMLGIDIRATTYGEEIIDSMKNGIFTWKIQNMGTVVNSINIGIDDADAKWIEEAFMFNTKTEFFAIHMDGGHAYSKNGTAKTGPEWKGKDNILTIKLEFIESMKYGKLMMSVDSCNFGEVKTISDQITRKKGLKYRLAVLLYHKGSKVELIE